ncbi:hypothetical protein [Micromonospora purpureochromogenes]|uniref:Uncharacterized protein n=1 Tax=Micromonospora purpureochromogenes TaxID=47872 RepID=A0ABX2RJQ0_9ACTN|nr:hypothetical protein [Micromonospora purpureochromogenes]NYF56521.1 hypothetical protein [Micromonospora purpureochromogenes]
MTAPSLGGRPAPQPSRVWFVVAALIAAGGVLSGMLLLLAPPGSLDRGFTDGQSVTVQLHPSSPRMVWAKEGPDGFPEVRCEPARLDPQLSTSMESSLFDVYELTVDGERWRGVLTILGSPSGKYEIVCRSSGAATSELAVGEAPWSYGLRHTALFRMATLGIPLSDAAVASVLVVLGTVAGLLIAVMVARRRRTLRGPGTRTLLP